MDAFERELGGILQEVTEATEWRMLGLRFLGSLLFKLRVTETELHHPDGVEQEDAEGGERAGRGARGERR